MVDSSVWIDYFNGKVTPQSDRLNGLLGRQAIAVGDLILTEVLQGFRSPRDFEEVRWRLGALTVIELGGHDIAIKAA